MDLGEMVARWPVLRQLRGPDRLGVDPRRTQIEGDPDSPVSRGRLCPN